MRYTFVCTRKQVRRRAVDSLTRPWSHCMFMVSCSEHFLSVCFSKPINFVSRYKSESGQRKKLTTNTHSTANFPELKEHAWTPPACLVRGWPLGRYWRRLSVSIVVVGAWEKQFAGEFVRTKLSCQATATMTKTTVGWRNNKLVCCDVINSSISANQLQIPGRRVTWLASTGILIAAVNTEAVSAGGTYIQFRKAFNRFNQPTNLYK